MPKSLKYALLPVSLAAALIMGGCNDGGGSGETPEVIVPKAQSYYKVRDIQIAGNDDDLFIASKEGLSFGHLKGGLPYIDSTYGEESLITAYLRFVAVDKKFRNGLSRGK